MPSDAYAADGDVKSTVEINDSTVEINDSNPIGDVDNFGISVTNIGDLNGDGVNDIAVGANGDDDEGTNRGVIYIMLMNTDGSVDETIEINDNTVNGPVLTNTDYWGRSIANIGDLNNDGVNDIAVGATGDDMDENDDVDGGISRGAVHIMFMNTDGSIDSTVEINDSTPNGPILDDRDSFGKSIANIGDLNNDGVNDIAVGAPGDDDEGANRGTIHIMFMNTNGSVDSTVKISDVNTTPNGPVLEGHDGFGASVANIGDLNVDGVNDIIVGAIGADCVSCVGDQAGAVYIMFMNTDGSVDSTVEINDSTPNGPVIIATDNLGFSVADIGDLNGDGVNDIAVGAQQDDGLGDTIGAVHIMFMNTDGSIDSTVEINHSATTGPVLSDDDLFGSSIANIGDWDGDGINDIAVGAYHDNGLGSNRGAIHIMFMVGTVPSTDSSVVISISPHIHGEVTVSINSNEEFTLNLKDEEIVNITSRVGDTVDITIGVSDDEKSFLSEIKLMTNFAQTRSQASGINPYFANNFNDYGKVGFSVYEWNQYKNDIKYDYGGAISWNEPSTMSHEIQTNRENVECSLNNEEELIIVFSLNMNNVMDETQIVTEIMDSSYQIKRSVLPFTLETLPKIIEKSEEITENPIISEHNESEFSIKSNKPMYEHGNKVVILGQIPADSFDPKNGEAAEFSITSPENEMILTGVFAPLLDGSFIFETYAMDSTWETDGNYTFNLKFGLIDSNLIISYDNSQFENVELQPIMEKKVLEENSPEIKIEKKVLEEKLPKLTIAAFVDQSKDPQHYTDRYFNEPKYKQWFDKNYPQYLSIYQAIGLEEPVKENIH